MWKTSFLLRLQAVDCSLATLLKLTLWLVFFKKVYFKVYLKILFSNPAGYYMFKVNNRSTRAKCEICPKLTIKTPERHHWRRSGVFIVNFEHISLFSSVFIVDFEQVNAGWVLMVIFVSFRITLPSLSLNWRRVFHQLKESIYLPYVNLRFLQ